MYAGMESVMDTDVWMDAWINRYLDVGMDE